MTEVVRRRLASLPVALTFVLAPLQVGWASPPAEAGATQPAATGSPSESGEAIEAVPTIDEIHAALETGDWGTARDLASERAEATHAYDDHLLAAEVWTLLADYEQAKGSLAAAADTLEDGDPRRDEVAAAIAEVEDRSRGTVAEEPNSTHRDLIDGERSRRLTALQPKPEPPPVDEPAPREPIIKQWYFWVTLTAIAASAGTIVGIAISNSVDNKDGGSASARKPASGSLVPLGGFALRF